MKRVAAFLSVGLVALAVAACEGPTAGDITFDLNTPHTDDGAVQFTATSVAPDSITGATAACSGCLVFLTHVSATEVRGVVTGDLGGGALMHLGVTDVGKPEAYAISVVAVASRAFKIQTGTYSLSAEK